MVESHGTQLSSPRPLVDSPNTGEVLRISARERDLICAISYVHLTCGQSAQSLSLLRLIAHDNSQDVDLLRILTYALISEGCGDQALAVLDRLETLDNQPSSRLPLMLLRSHALRQAGRMDEARALFQSYVSLRVRTALIEHKKDLHGERPA